MIAEQLKRKFTVELFPLGDTAIVVQFGQCIDQETNQKVYKLASYLDQYPFPGMVEYVPAFTTVTVYYDPIQLDASDESGLSPYEEVCLILQEILSGLTAEVEYFPKTIEIPVCYGGEWGPDLEFVAAQNSLSMEEVVKIHSGADYQVYMIGFAPGFPYLGGMPEQIAAPRRSSPRLSIPAGSVGIAGMQTGVYPIATPGGWQLIGRTPVPLFRPHDPSPSLLKAGDIIRFRPISKMEFDRWKVDER